MPDLFAFLAFFLAVIGVFGAVSFSVRQRFHEIGVRVALGARSRHVLAAVFGRVPAVTAAGLTMGALGGIIFGRLLSAYLFQIGSWDPPSFVSVAIVSTAACATAAYLAARRALCISPMDVLKSL